MKNLFVDMEKLEAAESAANAAQVTINKATPTKTAKQLKEADEDLEESQDEEMEEDAPEDDPEDQEGD